MIKGYITNLGKYNEGFLIGEWIEFPISSDDFNDVLNRIGINDEYEEYFFTDWDSDIDGIAEYFGEYPSIDEVNEVTEKIDNFNSYELDVFECACELWNINEVLDNDIDDFFLIDATNDYDLGYYWIEESGCFDTKSLGYLSNYIDYEAYGRDIRLEADGDYCSKGFIERR